MKREDVYKLIDGERDYQDTQWPEQAAEDSDARALSIGEDILLMEEYIANARTSWSVERRPETGALDIIRKIAGIVVRCMENHGAPARKLI